MVLLLAMDRVRCGGRAGIARLHAVIGEWLSQEAGDAAGQATVDIETDRGPWVRALIVAGYTVCGVSGAKSDAAGAHMLADLVRTDSHQLRPVAGDSARAEAGTCYDEATAWSHQLKEATAWHSSSWMSFTMRHDRPPARLTIERIPKAPSPRALLQSCRT
jgi:hypothetical protein